MPDAIKNNPAAAIAALRALVLALLTVGAAFGLVAPVTPDQQAAILELGGALTGVSLLFSAATVKTTVPKMPTPTAPPAAIQVPPAPPEARG